VSAREEGVADGARRISLGEQVADRRKVLEAFRHLFAHRVLQELRVQPVARELFSGRTLALGDLILMMRKDQVDPAGVNVEGLSQVLDAHRGALDVPAGPSRTQRRFPGLLPGFARLPEGEVPRVILAVFIDVNPGARLQAADIEMGKRAVAREGRDPKIRRPVGDIGVSFLG